MSSIVGRDGRTERNQSAPLLQAGGERLDLGVSLLGPAGGKCAPGDTRVVQFRLVNPCHVVRLLRRREDRCFGRTGADRGCAFGAAFA